MLLHLLVYHLVMHAIDFSLTNSLQIPGLIVEPVVFVVIAYFLAGLRASLNAFLITMLTSILVINVATSCGKVTNINCLLTTPLKWLTFSTGLLFSTAFDSVPLAMAYLVPFDYILMITSGAFMKLRYISKLSHKTTERINLSFSTVSKYWSWMQYLSWLMYANEAISIVQWESIQNIS